MNILITGINGFIGSSLARRLAKDGHCVRGIIRQTSDISFIRDIPLQLYRGDLHDTDCLKAACSDIDVVFHAAARASDWGSYREFFRINVEGTKNILEASCRAAVKRFVYISSTSVHGFHNCLFVREQQLCSRGIFSYARTKLMAEDWVLKLGAERGFAYVIIRPGNVYGPYDRTTSAKLAKALMSGRMRYINMGKAVTAPVYIDNLVDALILAMNKNEALGHTFIITDGLQISWKDYLDCFAGMLGTSPPSRNISYPLAIFLASCAELIFSILRSKEPPLITRYRILQASQHYHFDISKARQILGYAPSVGLEEGLARTAKWYLSEGMLLKNL